MLGQEKKLKFIDNLLLEIDRTSKYTHMYDCVQYYEITDIQLTMICNT